jgi:glycosyltransferase involved in cell wall biosynthesis
MTISGEFLSLSEVPMKILFLVPYAYDKAPSQRFRFEQYLGELGKKGWSFRVSPFLDDSAWAVLYRKGHFLPKVLGVFRGYFRRLIDLVSLFRYDVVFIHREASPFGPPWMEWLITKVFRKYTVFDFDDAIWIPNASETNYYTTRLLKSFSKTASIVRWSTVISCGNRYLADYASKYNSNAIVNPTTIDTEGWHNAVAAPESTRFVIGWTGSHSTVQVLELLLPVFQYLESKYDFELHVICDAPPKFRLRSLRFIPWSKEVEVRELLKFNVGIMPLADDEWARGKCGFKALQYMSVGVPAVVSNIGVNAEIVDHGVNGFVCSTTEDWKNSLEQLIQQPQLALELGSRARRKVLDHYSVSANTANFISLFELPEKR